MASISKSGKTGRYEIYWFDETGKRRLKRSKNTKRKDVEREAADLDRYVELLKLGIVDEAVAAAAVEIDTHVADFETHLQSRGTSTKQIRLTITRLKRVLRGTNSTRLPSIKQAPVEKFLVTLVTTGVPESILATETMKRPRSTNKPVSPKTRDEYFAVINQFCRWAAAAGRMKRNPLALVTRLTSKEHPEATQTFTRRPLMPDEVCRLIDAAKRRGRDNYQQAHPDAQVPVEIERKGFTRAMAYMISATLGVRVSALCRLTWADVVLGDHPHLILRAQYAKNRRELSPPMPSWLADAMKGWKDEVTSWRDEEPEDDSEVLSLLPAPDKLLRRLREDLAFAGIPEKTAEGRVDCHALRTSAATTMYEAGIDERVAATMLGASTEVIRKHYAKLRRGFLTDGAAKLAAPKYLDQLFAQ